MTMDGFEVWHGRQITAARALAGMTIRELAQAAKTSPRVNCKVDVLRNVLGYRSNEPSHWNLTLMRFRVSA
jgi:hypothetical protein